MCEDPTKKMEFPQKHKRTTEGRERERERERGEKRQPLDEREREGRRNEAEATIKRGLFSNMPLMFYLFT